VRDERSEESSIDDSLTGSVSRAVLITGCSSSVGPSPEPPL
jgi:hypothetical protein